MAESSTGLSDETLIEAATSAASVSVGEISQTNRSLSDIIALDKYIRQRRLDSRSMRSRLSGMITHMIPPAP